MLPSRLSPKNKQIASFNRPRSYSERVSGLVSLHNTALLRFIVREECIEIVKVHERHAGEEWGGKLEEYDERVHRLVESFGRASRMNCEFSLRLLTVVLLSYSRCILLLLLLHLLLFVKLL